MLLRPLVAYELGEIDASRGHGADEGRRRMQPLRVALRSTESALRPGFIRPDSKGCFATHLVGRLPSSLPPVAARTMREAIVNSLLCSSSAYDASRPTVRLVEPQVRTCGPDEADHLDCDARRRCVPIQDYACVAIPDEAPVGDDAKPYVEVCWARELGVRAQVPRAAYPAELRVVRHSPTTVAYHFVSFEGHTAPTLIAELPAIVVGQLFERRSTDPPPPPRVSHRDRLPRTLRSNRRALPDFLLEALAGFCQQYLRLHVLAALSAPVLTGRAFALDRGEFVSRRASERGQEPLLLCLHVHRTSSVCLCPAHNLPPIAQRASSKGLKGTFTDDSDVVMMIRMCGLEADADRRCPRHRVGCGNGFTTGVCCDGVTVELRCRHFVDGGAAPAGGRGRASQPGVQFRWVRNNMPPYAWETLTAILSSAAAYERALDPPGGVPARPTRPVLAEAEASLAAALKLVDDRRVAAPPEEVPTDDDLLRLDATAMQELMKGELGRIHVQTTAQQRSRAPASHPSHRPRLGVPSGVGTKGKPATPALRRLELYHGALFPAPGQALHPRVFDDGDTASIAPSDAVRSGDPDVDDTASTASGGGPPDKRRRLDPDTLEEFVDVDGIAAARRQLEALAAGELSPKQRERLQFFNEFLQQIVQNFEPRDVDGPREILCRRMLCVYKRKAAIGRLYTSNTKTMPDWSKDQAPRAICLQGAPRELRPFLCARLCRDYDMKNAQPQLLRQVAQQLEWHPPRPPPDLPELEDWCAHREAFIDHVAEVHALPADAERWEDFRKDAVKELVISLIFGGAYEGWLRRRGLDTAPEAPRSPKIVRLQRELAALREAVFTSLRWAPHVAEQRERLRREGKKETDEEIDRSVFALIAQSEEDRILAAMRQAADAQGFQVLSLQFDGFFVREKPGRRLDLADVSMRIARDTGYAMEVVEKPLFSDVWPTLSLVRADA